MTIGGMHNGVA